MRQRSALHESGFQRAWPAGLQVPVDPGDQGMKASIASPAIATLAMALFVTTIPIGSPAVAEDVYETSATMRWTPATGPVDAYAVLVNRNGEGFAVTPDQVVRETQVTLDAAYGDTLVVRVAALDAHGNQGPYSLESEVIHFVEPAFAIELSPSSLVAAAPQGSEPADVSSSITHTGDAVLDYSIASSESWLAPVSTSGSADVGQTADIAVRFDSDELAEGVYEATLTVSAAGVAPQRIDVTLTIAASSSALAVNENALPAAGHSQRPAK